MSMQAIVNGKEETVLSVAEMRAADAYTIAHFTSSRVLMHRAAEGIYHAAPSWQGRIAILAGGGNNGGDGYALACILADVGAAFDLFAVSEKLSEDGAYYRAQAQAKGARILPFTEPFGHGLSWAGSRADAGCDCAHQCSKAGGGFCDCGRYQQRHGWRYGGGRVCRFFGSYGIHWLL